MVECEIDESFRRQNGVLVIFVDAITDDEGLRGRIDLVPRMPASARFETWTWDGNILSLKQQIERAAIQDE